MRLSLLDRSRTRSRQSEGRALQDTIKRAQHAEELGFHRFWVAEHHAVPGIASGAPAVLLAAIGQVTNTIRLGSGGVMLPQHQPLIVAEQFRMLEGLYPGRVDLGVGRSLGFTPAVRRALRRESASQKDFSDDVRELQDYLHDQGAVTARPITNEVPIHVLATKSGIALAASLGLPVVIGGPLVLSPDLPDVLAEYRDSFEPGQSSRPHVMLSLDIFAAETTEHARELALPEAWAMAMSRRTGEFPPLESPESILGQSWPDRVRVRIDEHLAGVVTGTVSEVAQRLQQLSESTAADELLASTCTYDLAALMHLDDSTMEAVRRIA